MQTIYIPLGWLDKSIMELSPVISELKITSPSALVIDN